MTEPTREHVTLREAAERLLKNWRFLNDRDDDFRKTVRTEDLRVLDDALGQALAAQREEKPDVLDIEDQDFPFGVEEPAQGQASAGETSRGEASAPAANGNPVGSALSPPSAEERAGERERLYLLLTEAEEVRKLHSFREYGRTRMADYLLAHGVRLTPTTPYQETQE